MSNLYEHKKRLRKGFKFTLTLLNDMIKQGYNVDFLYYDYDFNTNLRINND